MRFEEAMKIALGFQSKIEDLCKKIEMLEASGERNLSSTTSILLRSRRSKICRSGNLFFKRDSKKMGERSFPFGNSFCKIIYGGFQVNLFMCRNPFCGGARRRGETGKKS